MKKVICAALALVLSASMFGCKKQEEAQAVVTDAMKYTVPQPVQYPDYTFDHEPTTDELRQMAVKAMRDMLSIQWCTPKFLTYQKTGAVAGKQFSYVPEITFAGLPYTNGDAAFFNWFEYYDTKTGQFNFPGDGAEFNQTLGNTCTGSIMWAWSTVCDSLTGYYDNYHMTYMNKCYPVGDYKTQTGIDSYLQYGTDLICQDNGREVILESYAQCLPADGLSSSPENHGMMVIEPATVVRKADGTIDAEESYLIIQDQRAGTGSVFYTQEDPSGETVHYSGRTYAKYSFEQLYNEWYVPVTTAEFAGLEAYNKAEITYTAMSSEQKTPEDMLSGMLNSNYPICILKLILTDKDGEQTLLVRTYLDKSHVRSGEARNYALSEMRAQLTETDYTQYLKKGQTYDLSLVVTVSTGEIFTVAEMEISK